MIFGFLIFPGLEEPDLVGPWELINFWSRFAKGPEKCIMIAENLQLVTCSKGMVIVPMHPSRIARSSTFCSFPEVKGREKRSIIPP
jgi:hypothetical protein